MESRFVQSIASQSLGRAWHHKLEDKLAACARHGFKAVEIFMEDLEYVASDLPISHLPREPGCSFPTSSRWDEQRISAARYIRHLSTVYHLQVICLQPFMHYEGLRDRRRHLQRIQELHLWILLAQTVGTDLIQIPSSFLPESDCSSDRATIIDDLREAADIGLSYSPPIRLAYEALCFGTHIDQWYDAWDIVTAVDRPNFGTCLDTFNMLGRVYADPEAASGCTASARAAVQDTIRRMRADLDLAKVFYVEACDGERLARPMDPQHEWHVPGQRSRMTWSRNARLFPFETPGYMPVMAILETLVDLGYRGYIAFELFSRTANAADPSVPEEHARRGRESWVKMMHHLQQYLARSSKTASDDEDSGYASEGSLPS